MVFEITTNGQSPGKRALGLRVIKAGGYPISFGDSAIRNLVRLVDFLPFCYGVGLLVMLINGNWQRLGDVAAGTVVVKTPRKKNVHLDQGRAPIDVTLENQLYSAWIQPSLVTDVEFDMIKAYLRRRPELSPIRRLELARTIGGPIAEKMGGEDSINFDKFLVEVYSVKTSGKSA